MADPRFKVPPTYRSVISRVTALDSRSGAGIRCGSAMPRSDRSRSINSPNNDAPRCPPDGGTCAGLSAFGAALTDSVSGCAGVAVLGLVRAPGGRACQFTSGNRSPVGCHPPGDARGADLLAFQVGVLFTHISEAHSRGHQTVLVCRPRIRLYGSGRWRRGSVLAVYVRDHVGTIPHTRSDRTGQPDPRSRSGVRSLFVHRPTPIGASTVQWAPCLTAL